MRLLIISFTIFLAFGCSRKPEGLSSISIHVPGLQGKVGALGAPLPPGRVDCYGVSVRGSGIPSGGSNSCHPEVGQTIGFVAAGGNLQAQIPKGSGRTFDIYLYLEPTGQSTPCPSMQSFAALSPDNLYLIGTVANVNLAKDAEVIDITTSYPGDPNSLYAQNSYAISCLPAVVVNKNGFQISTGVGDVTDGTTYKLRGRVGRVEAGPVLTGPGYTLKLKE